MVRPKSDTVNQFILVSKSTFDKSRESDNVDLTHSNAQTEPPLEIADASTIDDSPYNLAKQRIIESLEKRISVKRSDVSKIWQSVNLIVDAILSNKRVDVQLSDLQITLDGNPLENLSAPTFVYSLIRYNAIIQEETYAMVLRVLELPISVIKNKRAISLLNQQSLYSKTTHQTGGGRSIKLNATQNGREKKKNHRNKQAVNPERIAHTNKNTRWSSF